MEKELSEICSSILQLLDDHLIPTASSGESKVFYLKMKGDYHRYLAEFKTGTDRKDAAEHTLLAYKAAQVRLGGLQHGKPAMLHPEHAAFGRFCCRLLHAPQCLRLECAWGTGHRPGRPGTDPPHPAGPGAQLLCVLL